MLQIKQYLRGQDPSVPNKSLMGDYSLNEIRDYFETGKRLSEDKAKKQVRREGDDQIDLMKSIKKEKHLMRMQKDSVRKRVK